MGNPQGLFRDLSTRPVLQREHHWTSGAVGAGRLPARGLAPPLSLPLCFSPSLQGRCRLFSSWSLTGSSQIDCMY